MTETGGRQRPPRMFSAALALIGTALLLLLVACGSNQESPSTRPPTTGAIPPTGPTVSNDTARQLAILDARTHELVQTAATWHTPKSVDVDKTARIGLELGNGQELRSRIAALLPNTSPISGGTVEVGPTVKAKLLVDSSDADVVPSDAVDTSTGSDIQMLWTWFVHPKHPTSALLLTAHLEVPLSDGHTVATDVPLTIQVDRTVPYTAHQIFTNWATWSAIAAAVIGAGGWWWRGLHHKSEPASSAKRRPAKAKSARRRKR